MLTSLKMLTTIILMSQTKVLTKIGNALVFLKHLFIYFFLISMLFNMYVFKFGPRKTLQKLDLNNLLSPDGNPFQAYVFNNNEESENGKRKYKDS